jgi:predicted PurR-regulated permease PerM
MNTITFLICIAIAIVITLDVVIIIMLHNNTNDIMDYIFRYHNINEDSLKKIIEEITHIKKQQSEDCADVKYDKVNFVRDKKTGRFIRGNK